MANLAAIAKTGVPAVGALGLLGASEDAEATFGGTLAKNADLQALAKAEALHKAGVDKREIWKQTGWFQNAGDEWAFEMPDQYSNFNRSGVESLNARMPNGARQRGSVFLDELLDHPDLYNNYPQLKMYSVFDNLGRDGSRGSFDPDTKDIGLNLSMPKEDAHSTLLHEVQHALQDIENWPRGGSTDEFSTAASKAASAKLREVKHKMRLMLEAGGKYGRELKLLEGRGDGNSDRAKTLRRLRKDNDNKVEKLLDDQKFLSKAERTLDPYEQYLRIAGEYEARLVQARRHGDTRYPWDTPDTSGINPEELMVDSRTSPAHVNNAHKYSDTPFLSNVQRSKAFGDIVAPSNPRMAKVGEFLQKAETPFDDIPLYQNPVKTAGELASHLGYGGWQGKETAAKTLEVALDAMPLLKLGKGIVPLLNMIDQYRDEE